MLRRLQRKLTPNVSGARYLWLEHGGVFAVATCAAGGVWRRLDRAGMLDKKQNVFDDFIAALQPSHCPKR